MAESMRFIYYAQKKGEDAPPFVDGRICAVADGLGGSGKCVHTTDASTVLDELRLCAFNDFDFSVAEVKKLFEDTCAALAQGNEHTSAAWAARIVLACAVYALKFGGFSKGEYRDERSRAELARFIRAGLDNAAEHFGFAVCGENDEDVLLPTTFAAAIVEDKGDVAKIDVLWAGDSRCYVLTPGSGLQRLTEDDEDEFGAISNLFYAFNDEVELNLRSYEIKKPCAVLALSDGNFDLFEQGENVVLEYTFLSAIDGQSDMDGVVSALKFTYDLIGLDDATCVFAAFGFNDFADMRARFAERLKTVAAIERDIAEHGDDYKLIADDPFGYFDESAIKKETLKKFDTALTYLLTLYLDGKKDIALTYDVRRIFSVAVHKVGKPNPDGIKREFDRLFDDMERDPAAAYDMLRAGLPIVDNALKDINANNVNIKQLKFAARSLEHIEKERLALIAYAVEKSKRLDEEFYDDVSVAPTVGIARTADYAAAWRSVLLHLRGLDTLPDFSLLNDRDFVKRLLDWESDVQQTRDGIEYALSVELSDLNADFAALVQKGIADREAERPRLIATLAEQLKLLRAEMTDTVEKDPTAIADIFDGEAYMAFDKCFAVDNAAMPTLRMIIADNRSAVAAAVATGLRENADRKSALDTLYTPALINGMRHRHDILSDKKKIAALERLQKSLQKSDRLARALLKN